MNQSMPMPDAAGREPQLQEQIGYLNRTLETLECEVSHLCERLTPVIRMEPEGPAEVEPPEEEIVPAAASVRHCRRAVDLQAHRLRMLRDRIEV